MKRYLHKTMRTAVLLSLAVAINGGLLAFLARLNAVDDDRPRVASTASIDVATLSPQPARDRARPARQPQDASQPDPTIRPARRPAPPVEEIAATPDPIDVQGPALSLPPPHPMVLPDPQPPESDTAAYEPPMASESPNPVATSGSAPGVSSDPPADTSGDAPGDLDAQGRNTDAASSDGVDHSAEAFHRLRKIAGDRPRYPRHAARRRIEGTVRARVVVDVDGRVVSVNVIDGPEAFHRSVRRALRDYRFEAPRYDGQPVKAVGVMAFTFRLGR